MRVTRAAGAFGPVWLERVGRRCGAVAIGLLIDRAVGEPPPSLHPVAGFGTAMTGLEGATWADDRVRGAGYALTGVGAGWVTGRLVRSTALAVALAVAARELQVVAAGIGDRAAAGDLEGARRALPALVGRDPSDLDGSGIAAAVIESLAENTVDAVVAPVWWAVVAGAPGALAYRAVNTMDAMVGHRSERHRRFGWAAARLDDVANWIPARLYASLVALAVPGRARLILGLVRRDAGAHPSPNAGVAETAMAAAIGRTLGGPLRYGQRLEDRPPLGDGPRPDAADVDRALAVSRRVGTILTVALAAAGAATTGRIPNRHLTDRWRSR